MNLKKLRCPCGQHDRPLTMAQGWEMVRTHHKIVPILDQEELLVMRRLFMMGAVVWRNLVMDMPDVMEMGDEEADKYTDVVMEELDQFLEELGTSAEHESI